MFLPSQVSTICVLGGGNASQVLSTLIAAAHASDPSKPKVHLLAPYKDEAKRLSEASSSDGITLENQDGTITKATPHLITNDPAKALHQAQVVILPLPVFAIPAMCELIKPHLVHNAWVGLLPAQGGVQWIASTLLGLQQSRPDISIFGLDKLPYNCRTVEYGKKVHVFGYKERLALASIPNNPRLAETMATTLSAVIPKLQLFTVPNFLVATLAPSNQCIHPARMYSLFKDSTIREQIPLFYDMTEDDASYIQAVSDETQAIARGIEKASKEIGQDFDLSGVLSVGDAVLHAYDDVQDKSTLAKIFSTCKGFEGIGTPMKKVVRDGKTFYEVDWTNRYFTEDIPSLCVLHGLADIVGVKVPMIEKLIRWAQSHIDDGQYQYLLDDGSLNIDRKKVMFTPQYWGINTKEQLIDFHAVKETAA